MFTGQTYGALCSSIPQKAWLAALLGALGSIPAACTTQQPGAPSSSPKTPVLDSRQSENAVQSPEDRSHQSNSAKSLDAWTAASEMSPGINIGNTLENTESWETGWGNPTITEAYVKTLADLGFKTVRIPVAWDTYSENEKIQPDKMRRVEEVVDWSLEAGMFTVVNIHWDGGWIDSSNKEKFAETHATFSEDAERKFRSYWEQIATHFADKSEKLIFEGLNEETNFSGEGSEKEAYRALARVNQLFVDTVRRTGGNNGERLLIVTGYHTDFKKTCRDLFELPRDTVPNRLFLSVHYYTPWQFCGLVEDADWGKVTPTWGTPEDVAQQTKLFDMMAEFSKKNDIPVFLGEYNVVAKREEASRLRWLKSVTRAAMERKMVPVLWDTGGEVSRHAPHEPSPVLRALLADLSSEPPEITKASTIAQP